MHVVYAASHIVFDNEDVNVVVTRDIIGKSGIHNVVYYNKFNDSRTSVYDMGMLSNPADIKCTWLTSSIAMWIENTGYPIIEWMGSDIGGWQILSGDGVYVIGDILKRSDGKLSIKIYGRFISNTMARKLMYTLDKTFGYDRLMIDNIYDGANNAEIPYAAISAFDVSVVVTIMSTVTLFVIYIDNMIGTNTIGDYIEKQPMVAVFGIMFVMFTGAAWYMKLVWYAAIILSFSLMPTNSMASLLMLGIGIYTSDKLFSKKKY